MFKTTCLSHVISGEALTIHWTGIINAPRSILVAR